MLSPDNYVQDPSNSQNFNRYSYVMNNPLKYVDPTGEIAIEREDWYEDADGNVVYNENIKRQQDLEDAGIDGKYLGKEGHSIDPETGEAIHHLPDGSTTRSAAATVGVTITANQVAYRTSNPSMSSNNITGYMYNDRDLDVRNSVLSTDNPIARHIKSQERSGNYWILNSKDYWDYYGHTLGNMMLMDKYITMADMVSSGGFSPGRVSPRTFNLNRMPIGRTVPSSNPKSFSDYLKSQKGTDIGKYKGRGNWMRQKAKEYNDFR